jgi:hypothetical protein
MTPDWIDKQFEALKQLAEARFAPLSDAESKMLRAVVVGDVAWCGPSEKDDDPHNNPSAEEEWGPAREIRAELVRWLCVDKAAEGKIDSRGIRVHGAKISGKLDLSFAFIASVLGFSHCRFTEEILLRWATLANLSLHGSSAKSIDAQGVTIGGNLGLCHGFRAQDEVCLIGARIAGDLNCNGAQSSAVRGNRMTIEGDSFGATSKTLKTPPSIC